MRPKEPPASVQSHNNSQHVLAIINVDPAINEEILGAFGKTSALACDTWRDTTITMASNYPHCILQSENFCILCAGFAYHYHQAFGTEKSKSSSFARTVLDFCEANQNTTDLPDQIGRLLKQVSGHFSVYLVQKQRDRRQPQFWAWNDSFGFMPVYFYTKGGTIVLSSHWDSLVPALMPSMELDWDVVAEYLTLGTTLGGGTTAGESCSDRTFIKGIRNLSPGTCLKLTLADDDSTRLQWSQYTECYGACEQLLSLNGTILGNTRNEPQSTLAAPQLNLPPQRSSWFLISTDADSIRGVSLAKIKAQPPQPPEELKDNRLYQELFTAISSCVQEALSQGVVSRAALTGGGDTRLILACMLLLKKDHSTIIFQTHSKQKTDWLIARHLASMFRLKKHERIQATSTTVEGSRALLWTKEEGLLSNLHDQTPLRRKQRRREDKRKEEVAAYTLHGRFGTEFLGCLCFDKSPLDIRTQEELEQFRPKGTRWFEVMFDPQSEGDEAACIRNPVDTLQECFQGLERDKMAFDQCVASSPLSEDEGSTLMFDAAYAFQLQLFTRACLSDIYKGLRGGSWFSIPTAQFTRNAITPFLDNRLLQLMLCRISRQDKEEPYQLYGQLYQSVVPDTLRKAPSNNKLLCLRTDIPRAIKAPEATPRPFFPKFVNRTKGGSDASLLESKFNPVFWKAAVAIFQSGPVKMDPNAINDDKRPDIQALVAIVGAEDACLLSGRLQSFLLWYERRFLPNMT